MNNLNLKEPELKSSKWAVEYKLHVMQNIVELLEN